MKKAVIAALVIGLVTAPVQASDWTNARPGTFVGARLTIGGKTGGRPLAALTVAPTQNRMTSDGMTGMRIGEGIALNFGARQKPTLTLAGVRADQALGLTSGPTTGHGIKSGISDGSKVAIGVGVALVLVAGGTYLYLANRCTECDQ